MTPVRLSSFSITAALAAALEGGYFAEEGLEVDVRRPSSSTEQLGWLLDGTVDVIHSNADNIMKFRGRGHDVVVVQVLALGNPMTLVGSPDVVAWEGLRGRTVGVDAPDSGYAFLLYELLRRNDLARDAYDVAPVGNTESRLAALLDGRIAAALLAHRPLVQALSAGGRVLCRARDEVPDYPFTTVATTTAWAHASQQVLASYTRALRRAAVWAHDPANTDDVVPVLARARGIDVGTARGLLDLEATARDSRLPSAVQVRAALATVAELRERATGHAPQGYDGLRLASLAEESA